MRAMIVITLGATVISVTPRTARPSVSSAVVRGETCDVISIVTSSEVPAGTMALTSAGETVAIEQLLIPTRQPNGAFDVEVTRKGPNLYQIEGTRMLLVTRYCYHYGFRDKAVLRWNGRSGNLGSG